MEEELNLGLFNKAIQTLKTFESTQENAELCLFINEKKQFILKRFNAVLLQSLFEVFFEKGMHESIYSYYNESSQTTVLMDRLFSISCYKLGRMQEYLFSAKQCIERMLVHKYYSMLSGFLTETKDYLGKKDFHIKANLILLCEIGDEESLALLEPTKQGFSFYEVLSRYSLVSPDAKRLLLKSKILESETFEMLPMESIEYVLLCENRSDLFLLFESDSVSEFVKQNLLSLTPKSAELTKYNKQLKQALKTKNQIKIVKPADEHVSFPRLYPLGTKVEQEVTFGNGYKTTVEEKKLMTQFSFEHRTEQESIELINSFIPLCYFNLAILIAKKLEPSHLKSYYLAYLSFKSESWVDAIYYLNEYLITVEPPNTSPFLRMKQISFMALGDKAAAKKIELELIANGEPTE